MTLQKLTVILFILTLFAGMLLSGFLVHRGAPATKENLTAETIRRCEWVQKRFSYLSGGDLAAYLHKMEAQGVSLGQAFNFMLSNPQEISNNSLQVTNPPIQDAWGRPLNLIWREATLSAGVSDVLAKKRLVVLVWSSGPNGTNELGRGDDIVVR